MEDERKETEEKEVYVPRPAWQVWAARAGIVIVLAGFIAYCLHIAFGGQ